MPELTVTVHVPLPKQSTLASLERVIFKALQAAGRELLVQAFAILEQTVICGARQRRRRRYLITRFGALRFSRWQTRTERGYDHPLDDALGLAPGDPSSAWVRETAAWLAHPYRQAARVLGRMIGARSITGGCGAGCRPRAGRSVHTSTGCAPRCSRTVSHRRFTARRPRSCPPRPTAPSSAPPTGRWRSRSGCGGPAPTARARARDTRGSCWTARAPTPRPKATTPSARRSTPWLPPGQALDQFHGKLRISEVARDPERAARWWAWVTEHNLGALARSISILTRSGRIDPDDGRVLLHYPADGLDAFETYQHLRDAGHPPQMAPRGSGAQEGGARTPILAACASSPGT